MTILTTLTSIPHNQHYLKRYIRFVSTFIGQAKTVGVTELHHICPESLFPQFADLRKNRWNSVHLTHRQHFVAHWILWKAFNNSEMQHAFWCMNSWNRDAKITSRVYQQLKEQRSIHLSEWLKSNNPMHNQSTVDKFKKPKSDNHKKKIGESNKGKHSKPIHTTEQKQRYSEMMSGDNNPMSGKSAVKGKKWYNNGSINLYLSSSEEVPIGFIVGRITGWNTHP